MNQQQIEARQQQIEARQQQIEERQSEIVKQFDPVSLIDVMIRYGEHMDDDDCLDAYFIRKLIQDTQSNPDAHTLLREYCDLDNQLDELADDSQWEDELEDN